MTGSTEYTIYPQSCFHLSRTVNCWLPLKAQQIHALDSHPDFEVKNVYFHLNHPIMWVKVVGIVVAIDEWSACRTYTIDDSSGATIECVANVPEKLNVSTTTKAEGERSKGPVVGSDVDVGDCIQVTGCIIQTKRARKIKTTVIKHLQSTAEEVRFWNKLVEFQRDVLSQPWVLTEKEVRRCRRQASEEPKDIERKQRVKERRRQARKTGLKTRSSSEAVPSEQRENPQRRSTGLERKAKRIKTADGETLKDTAGQVTEHVLRKPMPVRSSDRLPTVQNIRKTTFDTQTTVRLKETGLERTCKRSKTSQSGGTAATSLDTTRDLTEESLLEAEMKVAAKTGEAGSAPAPHRWKLVRLSTGIEGVRDPQDEVTASDKQTASRRRTTGLERKSGRPIKSGEHEARVVAPGPNQPYEDNGRRSDLEAVTHVKPSGLEPESKRPRVGRTGGGSSTEIGKRAKYITTALDAVRTRVTGLEPRKRRPTGTRIEGA
ncbi:hypothetical protein DL546_009423 [Coniochaeta pulveracea]|uniref:CST complex subunit Stn1 N-terminal domain-containing protein n=1 Tax=Coniochaeta pulveracea TaxID=177199 RepID=A0A420YLC3_9PEZI|nr:hypothetical protein DL546_009423 [Coniochaeta pulveracea]